jgi:hypothetical protein
MRFDGQADGADRVALDIDTAMFGAPMGDDTKTTERVDHAVFDRVDERDDLAETRQPADRVHDELPRTVIGDVAAALDGDDLDPARGQQRPRNAEVDSLALRPRVTTGSCSTTSQVSAARPSATASCSARWKASTSP